MKILFLTPRFPYPPLKGEQVRAYNFIKNLSDLGHEIYLLSFCNDNDKGFVSELEKYCKKVICVKVSPLEKILSFIFCLFKGYPIQIFPFFSRNMENQIRQLVQTDKFDIIQIELIRMAHFKNSFRDIPVVIDLVDCLGLNMKRRFEKENILRRIAFYFEWKRMERYERKIVSTNGKYLVVSKAEKNAFDNNKKIEVLPIGIEIIDNSVFSKNQNKIVFTGNMAYFPNNLAVKYFVKNIFPLIKNQNSLAEFHIVGANPSKKICKMHNGKDIFVHGFVENMFDQIKSACVSVAPLTTGTGVQIKVLEAMASGTPVVATSFAVQGIECESEKHLFVRDDPQSFSQAVIDLMKNEKKREKISSEALKLIKEKYNWRKIVEKLIEIYSSFLRS